MTEAAPGIPIERRRRASLDGPVTAERLRELLSYDAETGEFTWRVTLNINARQGEIAGYLNSRRYRVIWINRRPYLGHRLAWLYVNDEWPANGLDHIDCDTTNNKIANLRLATPSQNVANRRRCKNNVSGFKGVSPFRKKWRAQLTKNGKSIYLGLFSTPAEAHKAYCIAAEKLHGEFARFE